MSKKRTKKPANPETWAVRVPLLLLLILFAIIMILTAVTPEVETEEKIPAGVEASQQLDEAVYYKTTEAIATSEELFPPDEAEEEIVSEDVNVSAQIEAISVPEVNARYADLELSQEDIDLIAAITFLEAGNQSTEGQQAVVEVILNRVIASNFPDTVYGVIYEPAQFTTAASVATATAGEIQYEAIYAALHEDLILPEDVVYFSRKGENSRVWGTIGAHVFCRQYIWG